VGYRAALLFTTVLLSAEACMPASTKAATCESLADLKLPNTTVTSAQTVAAGTFTLPESGLATSLISPKSLPAFCRVVATLRPSKDSDIKIEVWLPLKGWNGKLESVGNGGYAGFISYATPSTFPVFPSLMSALQQGYATASTDTGHSGGLADASFALGHPEKVTDWGYRAVHEMTLKAKAIIAAFYGKSAHYSYFNGCSTGGRQALKEAQRYPNDYDGIIAGAPANYNWTHLVVASLWVGVVTHKDPASFIPPSKYPVIHDAVIKACDAVDGLKDGLIDDPRRCHFDPKVLECSGADASTCLTAPQVESAKTIYGPVTNPRTGVAIFPGLEPGSELGWSILAGGKEPSELGITALRNIVYQDANWDWRTFDFDKGVALAEKVDQNTITANDRDLRPFLSHGGKLLIYHGWTDPVVASESSVNYYTSVLNRMGGASKASSSIRLFMVPGMDHCGGGEGPNPNVLDFVSVMEQWVEKGVAPNRIIATKYKLDDNPASGVVRTRPLCPYPQVARYTGSGSTDEAPNFVCKAPPRSE